MNRALLLKELAHHGPAVLWLAASTLAGLPVLISVANLMEGGSGYDGLRTFLRNFAPVLTAVLCHRLVVLEYQERTQLFLEGLPVSRTRMLLVKFLFGLGVAWGLVLLATGLTLVVRAGVEPLDVRLLVNVLARALGWAWGLLGLFFLMGLLGRYRVAFFLLLVLLGAQLAEVKEVRLAEFGPFVLVNSQFGFERDALPFGALAQTILLGLGLLALAALLSCVREGSVAALLAQKMSRRERVFCAALMAGVFTLLAALPERRRPMELDFGESAHSARVGAAEVQVSNAQSAAEPARRLAHRTAQELSGAFAYLGLSTVPPVFITLRRDLTGELFDRAPGMSRDGITVDADFTAPGWREADFIAWLVRVAVLAETRQRAGLEHKLWVLDGFPDFWLARQARAISPPPARHRVLTLRALYGTREGLTRRDLETWLRFRERVGPEIAGGVAASGLVGLERRWGAERCQAFLRRVLATEVPKDFRAALHEARFPPARLLELEAGVSLDEFARQWMAELEAARSPLQAELAALPVLQGEVKFIPIASATMQVQYLAVASPAPPPQSRLVIEHCALPVLDQAIRPEDVRRESKSFPWESKGTLPMTAARGSRLGWNFALEVPALECRVISGWRREEVR